MNIGGRLRATNKPLMSGRAQAPSYKKPRLYKLGARFLLLYLRYLENSS